MQIAADRDICAASGQCASVAAALFDQDDDGIVVLLHPEPGEADEPLARRAVSLCPSGAIRVIETPGPSEG